MPYINQDARDRLDFEDGAFPETAGELNYVLTLIAHEYWEANGQNYQAFNDILGALEGCKLELYRRKIAPYEDEKIWQNGDV